MERAKTWQYKPRKEIKARRRKSPDGNAGFQPAVWETQTSRPHCHSREGGNPEKVTKTPWTVATR
jgi:hypothetical protein